MRVFISGQKYFGQLVLEAVLKAGHTVTGVCAPFGESKPDRLFRAAQRAGLPIVPGGELRAEILPGGTDLIIAAHSYDFIGRKTRLKAKLGAIGYHPSLLPRHRGRDAVRWALRFGDFITGGTVYWLDDGVDTGAIAAQDWCWVQPNDDAADLWRRELQPMGVRLILKTLNDLQRGVIVSVPQNNKVATWEPSIGRPPIFRPELPQIGAVSGFTVVKNWAFVDAATEYRLDT